MSISCLARSALWNAFLAVIPVALAYVIVWTSDICGRRATKYMIMAPMALIWLAFVPNTCYLITEWRHFLQVVDANNLFLRSQNDKIMFVEICALSMFYLGYSGLGVITFALATRPIERLAARRGASIWFWAVPFFTVVSLGVYLGLVLRFNTWDLLTHPRVLWSAIVEVSGRPRLVAFIVAFGVFLWAVYEATDIWVDGLTERWSQLTGRRIHLGPDRNAV